MAAGKVEIGAFRTYSDAHQAKITAEEASGSGGGSEFQSIPLEKIEGRILVS